MDYVKFCESVDKLQGRFIDRLRDAIEIPSVSSETGRRADTIKMAHWTMAQMKELGVEVRLKSLGKESGTDLDLPPLILGRFGNDADKPTIMVYSHYDVQPASLQDGWEHDPWTLTESNEVLHGRGTSDDKGPLVNWLNMLEAFQDANQEVPVNLAFFLEGMEENGSVGFRAALEDEANQFLSDVDAVCLTDVAWASNTQPTIPRGLRGVLFYRITIRGAQEDAHSGLFGGAISEPMTDIVNIMSSLVDSQGKLLIPGIYDAVLEVTDEERESYEKLPLTPEALDGGIGGRLLHATKAETIISKWRQPSLSLHRIENLKPGPGATTSIPAALVGKFSIRTVPRMEASEVDALVRQHIEARFKQLQSKNELDIVCVHQSDWFYEDVDHWNYQAAIKAIEQTWDVTPPITCEGGSIPIALDMKKVLKKNVLLLPVGRPTDGIHSVNEKLDKINYFNAIKVYGSYLGEIAARWQGK
ncbi:M20-dimer domain-containing protein [Fusarium falciforme]|uniref:M20-dimer domain-containing protein n=1 Tax=Fusarium falciforme TaxID=195108 RepID=UPI0022FFFEFC|nr:M20-dimer domain-containing protein [Fusarium falciforme]WAO91647.1 M20-dimer domain-containing protein [Fusarium falciforme]